MRLLRCQQLNHGCSASWPSQVVYLTGFQTRPTTRFFWVRISGGFEGGEDFGGTLHVKIKIL